MRASRWLQTRSDFVTSTLCFETRNAQKLRGLKVKCSCANVWPPFGRCLLRKTIFSPLHSSLTMQDELLTSIMSAVSKRVNGDSFNIWFQPISAASKDGSVIYMSVPNEVFS